MATPVVAVAAVQVGTHARLRKETGKSRATTITNLEFDADEKKDDDDSSVNSGDLSTADEDEEEDSDDYKDMPPLRRPLRVAHEEESPWRLCQWVDADKGDPHNNKYQLLRTCGDLPYPLRSSAERRS
ncbi:hypothetical protein M885DRAFT_576936 [Pelagophyceae sp. CCMP2097]|nr:hypothetical protein M885DRAFT_576936 [Pelagophyceae sp. CCMP2097]